MIFVHRAAIVAVATFASALIKASIVTNFMDANGVAYATGCATQPMQPADLADQAKAMCAFVECQ